MALQPRVETAYFCRIDEPLGSTIFSMASPTISAAQRANVKFIEVCQAGSKLSLKEKETVLDSVGTEHIVSYELQMEALIMQYLTQAQEQAIDGVQSVFVLIPRYALVGTTTLTATIPIPAPGTSLNLGSSGVSIPSGYPCDIITSTVGYLTQERTFGEGKVAPAKFLAKATGPSKDALLKRCVLS